MKSLGQTERRSPLLMSRDDTALVVIDLQPRLLNAIAGAEVVIWNAKRLATGASLLGLPVLLTEQVPSKLGNTTKELEVWCGNPLKKSEFSCCEFLDRFEQLSAAGHHRVLLAGVETHICIQQSALDLLAAGFEVFIAVDAVASRFDIDHATALHRMQASGVTLTTVEAALMEWTVTATDPAFREISGLLKQPHPTQVT